jgi:hypothetical protein
VVEAERGIVYPVVKAMASAESSSPVADTVKLVSEEISAKPLNREPPVLLTSPEPKEDKVVEPK